MTESFYNLMKAESEKLKLTLSDDQIGQFFTYYQDLIETNKVMNLTSITEEKDVVLKHFVDCLSFVRCIPSLESQRICSGTFNLPMLTLVQDSSHADKVDVSQHNVSRETLPLKTPMVRESSFHDFFKGKKLIDVGTGAGFPGLVLKIAFPELNVLLSDSLQKRLNFLDKLIDKLELKGVETVHGRAEDLAHDKCYREKFDLCVSRAVAKLPVLCEYDLPFVKLQGYFVAMKAGDYEEEVKSAEHAISVLGGKLQNVEEFSLPFTSMSRSLIVIRKAKETSRTYPRKAGTPGKRPL